MPDNFLWVDLFAYVHFGLRMLLILVAALLSLSGLDDSALDICHHIRRLYRRLVIMPRYRPMTLADLKLVESKKTAILVPAWRESAVIGDMLHQLLKTIDYNNYVVFVGVYPNDTDTRAAIARAAPMDPRIRVITNPAPGPTSKGDCLNVILDAIFRQERASGDLYEVFVLHDAEDVVHPLELRLFAKLIPRKAMVQLPVVPLEASPLALTAAHYMDEFAEHHTKDMAIREALTGGVPSAGVGCAFSRQAILALKDGNGGAVFDAASVTEDYAAAMRLQRLGMPLIFLRFQVQRLWPSKEFWFRRRWRSTGELIGTREYFPMRLGAAVRQKARWLTGIVFQGWREFGWRGSLATRYALFRDRKAIATAQISLLANALVIAAVGLFLAKRAGLVADTYPPLVTRGSWLYDLLLVNAAFLTNRVLHRAYYVYTVYGLRQALASPLRLLWGNYINFLACNLALWQVTRAAILGRTVGWAKTDHLFPAPAELAFHRKRLGDLMLESGLADADAITAALDRQRAHPAPLGEILVNAGVVSEDQVLRLVAAQRGLAYLERPPSRPLRTIESGRDLPAVVLRQRRGSITVASSRLLSDGDREHLAKAFKVPVEQVLVSAAWLQRHLRANPEEAPG